MLIKRGRITKTGVAGLTIALLALAAAVMAPWVIAAVDPPPKPIDEIAVDIAGKIKNRIAAKAQGKTYATPAPPARSDWYRWYSGGIVAAGVAAIAIGLVGLVARHDGRLNAASVVVGASAILFQYALMLALLLILVLLVGFTLAAFGD
jgi:hypothetical protein